MKALLLALLWLAAPGVAQVNGAALLADVPAAKLSAYGLFDADGRPDAALIPYAPTTPLFSDHAEKARFLWLPPGTRVGWRDSGVLAFPVGAVLVKSFGYTALLRQPAADTAPARGGGASGRGAAGYRTIETRLLIRKASGWVALPYVWEGGDAALKKAGARLAVEAMVDGKAITIDYAVPNMNQCKGCHALDGVLGPIGPKARNLDDATLRRLKPVGMPALADVPRVPAWDGRAPVAARARAYLDANCGHCHNARGPAGNSGLFLDWENRDRVALGIGKRPVAAGQASGGLSFDVKPGDPAASIMVHRMQSVEPGVAMPELGRSVVHEAGVALIRDWIAGLSSE
ncbi:SO2930 family diheme c-type cytochrome [Sandaracinobacteroides saxicola]|uniref:Cytochrome c domain-containing protein n=1 Tax=Sandaracinobacteroides saxicola TaxID=2759707 RepID=A0A7G5IGK1_9SPHN|nr:SO2930 family diheme c-type cytochrome [Sandaracinobacteroides saxicola]QMW22493.1 hypothetical protein H3309_14310 [Sandaracinobacteroides saxicola]